MEEKTWKKLLDNIKPKVSLPEYKTWFLVDSLTEIGDNAITISTPSAFIKDSLVKRHWSVLEESVKEVLGENITINLKVDSTLAEKNQTQTDENNDELELEFYPASPTSPQESLILNPKYSLKNFVVGLSNNLAYAAAQAVVQNPGVSYNPLFIYGGTGVGKTHLMQAIGNELFKKDPSIKIIYCSSEKFMNDFIQSIQTKRNNEFRKKYRDCNLFLVDDIQFVSGRDSTQEEFFHTFNELQGRNTQVVLTSDRPPNEIQKLEPRLASRFQGGLMVDIQTPDFDTRVAILKAKCNERGWEVSEESLTIIAENMSTNARELEGKLIQIVQASKLLNDSLTPDYIRAQLGKAAPLLANQKLDHKKLITHINNYFNIKMVDLTGPRRNKELVLPRQLAMYLMYEECQLPYERIGEILGGRDHTTIMHGVDKIKESSLRDREVARMLIEIKQVALGGV